MGKVGAYLRTQRERKGLSYEQIYEITRISPDVLKKIETDQPLSAPVFFKGFIKTYAEALGLDSKPLLQELRDFDETPEESAAEGKTSPPVNLPPHWLRKRKKLILAVCAGFALLPVTLFVAGTLRKPDLSQERSLEKITPAEEKTEEENMSAEFLNDSLKIAPPPSLFSAIRDGYFRQEVMIHSQQPLNIYFKPDGDSVVTHALSPKSWYVIKALEKIYLRIDDPAQLKVIHNGKWRRASSPLEQTFD